MDHYAPAPGLALGITGHRTARAHFTAEYGAPRPAVMAATDTPDVLIDVRFVARLPPGAVAGGHKTVRWAVHVTGPHQQPLSAQVFLAGAPRAFALALAQGFVVEPLISVAAVRAGQVLLPAAALESGGEAVVLLGRSRSGKTSIVARAVAAGARAWGDDQVLLDGDGRLRPWPRRLRVYPDLRFTAPAAVAALPYRQRARLTGLAALAALSRGWAAPSLPLAWNDLGGTVTSGPVRARRVVVIERGADQDIGLAEADLQTSELVGLAAEVLREQRDRLCRILGDHWRPVLTSTEQSEAVLLSQAFRDVPAQRWTVPASWSAARAVATLAERLGVRS